MPIQNVNNVKTRDKVSYEDMANPLQTYTVVATPSDFREDSPYKLFRIYNKETKTHKTVTLEQYGWTHHPA